MLTAARFFPSPPRDPRTNERFFESCTSVINDNHLQNTPQEVSQEQAANDSTASVTNDEGAILPWVNTARPLAAVPVAALQCKDVPCVRPKRRKRSTLTFNETITVVAIPMRNEYSRYVRSKLWSNRQELQQNAARNAIEFVSEGWNWRTVVEDEHMYVCAFSGELIHPCHCDPQFDAGTPRKVD